MIASSTPLDGSRAALGGKDTFSCVWSHGRGCDAHIPAEVVVEAWRDEMELAHRTDGFFHFAWNGGTWLGYGMPDGSVRGVYCATHRAERAGRLTLV